MRCVCCVSGRWGSIKSRRLYQLDGNEHAQDGDGAGPGAAARGEQALEAADVHPHVRLCVVVVGSADHVGVLTWW